MKIIKRFMIKDLRFKNKTRTFGFTLIELLVSISIIAILIVVTSASFTKAQKNGRDQRRIDDLKSIQSAAEQYYLLGGNYPAAGNYRPNASAWTINGQIVLNKFPSDPKNVNGVGITYAVSATTTGYCVCASMENTKNANSAINCSDFVNNLTYFCVKNQQ